MAATVMSRISNQGGFDYATNGKIDGKSHEKPETLTRYLGGHNRMNHPYTSGYWQLFLNPPVNIFKTKDGKIETGNGAQMKEASGGQSSRHEKAINWFHATAESFQPPSRTLSVADVPAQGGLGASFVTGQQLNRQISFTFREWRDLPMMKLFELWTSIIDPYTGVSEFEGTHWVSKAYKGCAFVALTKPVGSYSDKPIQKGDIEEVYFFHGVFPEAAPYETFASDIQGNDVAQLNVSFRFDGWPLTKTDDGVVMQFLKMVENLRYMKTYVNEVSDVINQVTVLPSTIAGPEFTEVKAE